MPISTASSREIVLVSCADIWEKPIEKSKIPKNVSNFFVHNLKGLLVVMLN